MPYEDMMDKKNRRVRSIGIVFNLKRSRSIQGDAEEEYDELATIDAIESCLRELGFSVRRIEYNRDFAQKIQKANIDFVLNIAEGQGSDRGRESQVPCILESFGIPYSGSDPVALGLTLDKYLTSCFLRLHGIPVPQMHQIRSLEDLRGGFSWFVPRRSYIIKPRWEGSSKGILQKSLVHTLAKLKQMASWILSTYRQPAVVEEFLPGDEITASVAGNKKPFCLGMMRIRPRSCSQKPFLYSLEVKRDWRNQVTYEAPSCISFGVRSAIERTACQAFSVLELRDIARFDFRLSARKIPKIIDINPLPGLSPVYSDLPILFNLNGGDYRKLIKLILKSAFARYQIPWENFSS